MSVNPVTQTSQRRTHLYRLLALATFVAILLILSLPGPRIEALQSWIQSWWPWPASGFLPSNFLLDKLLHASLFSLCAALFVRGWTTFAQRWWLLCVMLILYGGATELIQRYVPGRSATPGDLLADAVAEGEWLACVNQECLFHQQRLPEDALQALK